MPVVTNHPRIGTCPTAGGESTGENQLTTRIARGLDGALLLGGDAGALGIARSLGRAGIPVIFLPGVNPIAKYSRYVSRTISWPGAEAPGAAEWLLALANTEGLAGWVLFPSADSDVRLVAKHHDALAHAYRLTTPPWENLKWAADKHLTSIRAAELGIPHPRTYTISNAADARDVDCQFPLILKPAAKQGVNALTRSKVWLAHDRAELVRMFEYGSSLAGDAGLVVQEFIPGGDAKQFSYAAACLDGQPLVSMTARRSRQVPAGFGTGTFVETLGPMPYEAEAERFLRSISYTGLVEMEFKLDQRDGRYKLLDVNPRVWTWNALGVEAGVDFALAMWKIARGEAVMRARAKPGAAWLYLTRDLSESLKQMRRGALRLPDYAASLMRRKCYAIFADDDPLPAVIDLPIALARRWREGR